MAGCPDSFSIYGAFEGIIAYIYVRVFIYKGAEKKILGIFELTLKRAFVFN